MCTHAPRTGFSGANEPSWYAKEFRPYTGCSTQPFVAVVVKVHRKEVYFEGVGRHLAIPFGGVDLLLWDLDRLRFGRLMQEVKMPFTIYSVPTMLLRTWSCVPSPAAHY